VSQKLLKRSEIEEKSKNLKALKNELLTKVKEKRNNSTKVLKSLYTQQSIFPKSSKVLNSVPTEKSMEASNVVPEKAIKDTISNINE